MSATIESLTASLASAETAIKWWAMRCESLGKPGADEANDFRRALDMPYATIPEMTSKIARLRKGGKP